MEDVVAELRLRTGSNRWGLNWKRGNVGDLSQDIVTYYAGPEGTMMRNSTTSASTTSSRPLRRPLRAPFWVDQTGQRAGRHHRPLDLGTDLHAATVPRRARRERRLAVPGVPIGHA